MTTGADGYLVGVTSALSPFGLPDYMSIGRQQNPLGFGLKLSLWQKATKESLNPFFYTTVISPAKPADFDRSMAP